LKLCNGIWNLGCLGHGGDKGWTDGTGVCAMHTSNDIACPLEKLILREGSRMEGETAVGMATCPLMLLILFGHTDHINNTNKLEQ